MNETTPSCPDESPVERLLRLAVEAMRQGDDEAAGRHFREAESAGALPVDAACRLGAICRERRDWAMAKFWMSQDAAAGRMSAGWQLRYAEVLAELGDAAEAERLIEEVYGKEADAKDGFARIGGVFMRRREWRGALEWMERDEAAGRMSPAWMLHLASVCFKAGRREKAEPLMRAVYQRDATLFDRLANLGWSIRFEESWAEARKWLRMDAQLGRLSPRGLIQLGHAEARCGDVEAAIPLIELAYSLDSTQHSDFVRIAWFLTNAHAWKKAMEVADRDIRLGRISLDWHLRILQKKAELGEWREAQIQLRQLWRKTEGRRLPLETYFLANDTALKIGDTRFGDAILATAREWYPHQQASVQLHDADRKQAALASAWLAEKGRIPFAVKAGRQPPELVDFTEQWEQAFAAYVALGELPSHPSVAGSHWKMTRCGLQLSENYRQQGRVEARCDTLDALLRCIAAKLPEKERGEIVGGLAASVPGETDVSRLLKPLLHLEEGRQAEWIAISDFLQWHGHFRLGHQAWERSIAAAYREAELEAENPDAVGMAFRAAMITADYERAGFWLRRGRGQLHESAGAYLALHLGDRQAMLSLYPAECHPGGHLARHVRGKTIAIVAPAPGKEMCGAEIDAHDVVIRPAFIGKSYDVAEFGSRTTAANYSIHATSQWRGADARPEFLRGLCFYTMTPVRQMPPFVRADQLGGVAFTMRQNVHNYHRYMNAIQRLVYDLVHATDSPIHIFKTNFFLSRTTHHKSYTLPNYTMLSAEKAAPAIAPLRHPMVFGHDLLCQLGFIRNLWQAGIVDVDVETRAVLELSDAEYMAGIEEIHGAP